MSDTPKINLKINKGETFRFKFLWLDSKKRPVNLEGYTARMQIRADASSPDVLVLFDSQGVSASIVLGGRAGTIALYLSDTATSAMGWTKGVYDLELVAPLGDVTRLVGGNVVTTAEVTRAIV